MIGTVKLTSLASAMAILLLTAGAGAQQALPPPPAHENGQVLWHIVHDRCVPDQREHGDPSPCALVATQDGEMHGFAVLKDRDGVAQYLLLPTAVMTGIEDPALLAPDAVNYFALAWNARGNVESRLGHALDRSQISVAVNSPYGRTQDQLHLHIDCLDAAITATLRAADIPHDGRWVPLPLQGHAYRVHWLNDGDLAAINPFRLLAESLPGAREAMGAWTLALVGARGPDSAQGFYVLADRVDLAAGDAASAEELQDHACRL